MTRASLPKSCAIPPGLYRGSLFAIDDWLCHGHDTPRGHEEWCGEDRVVVTRRGVWDLEVEGHAQRCDPTAVTFWPRETPYRVRHPIGGRDQCTVFRLTAAGRDALVNAGGTIPGGDARETRSRAIDGPTHFLHRRALDAARSPGDPLAIEEAGTMFLQRISAGHALTSRRGTQPAVDRALDFMAAEFRRPLTIAQVAQAAAVSPFHLSRLFRRTVGTSLHRHVLTLRLREALERVAEADGPEPLATLALDLGFASHSHFTDAFRAEYGVPPSRVRQQPRRTRRSRRASRA